MQWYEDPVYIKQCEKAEEIQEHTPKEGDFYWGHIDGTETVWVVYSNGLNNYEEQDWGTVWLPRQDQLQEMLGIKTVNDCEELCSGKYMIGWDDGSAWFDIEGYDEQTLSKFSMEQLWLALAMHEKFSKRWDSDKSEWVKEAGPRGSNVCRLRSFIISR